MSSQKVDHENKDNTQGNESNESNNKTLPVKQEVTTNSTVTAEVNDEDKLIQNIANPFFVEGAISNENIKKLELELTTRLKISFDLFSEFVQEQIAKTQEKKVSMNKLLDFINEWKAKKILIKSEEKPIEKKYVLTEEEQTIRINSLQTFREAFKENHSIIK